MSAQNVDATTSQNGRQGGEAGDSIARPAWR